MKKKEKKTCKMVKVKADRANRFVRGHKMKFQGFIRAFRSIIQVDALRFVVDISMHERVDLPKTIEMRSSLCQKRKVQQQSIVIP